MGARLPSLDGVFLMSAPLSRAERSAIVESLNSKLGPMLVSALAGAVNYRVARAWASRHSKLQPTKIHMDRIDQALQAWDLLITTESSISVRTWFMAPKPQLGDISPVEAIAAGHGADVITLATNHGHTNNL